MEEGHPSLSEYELLQIEIFIEMQIQAQLALLALLDTNRKLAQLVKGFDDIIRLTKEAQTRIEHLASDLNALKQQQAQEK